jgi:hypothetical protein
MELFMTEVTHNSPLDICRVLAIAMLADSKIDDREIEALTEMGVGKSLGVSAAEFRKLVSDLCKGVMVDEAGRPTASITDLNVISEISTLIGRNAPSDSESVKRLLALVNEADPTLVADQLLDEERLNSALDRITDARLRLWTSYVLLRVLRADGVLAGNEKVLLRHVFKRWNMSPEAFVE